MVCLVDDTPVINDYSQFAVGQFIISLSMIGNVSPNLSYCPLLHAGASTLGVLLLRQVNISRVVMPDLISLPRYVVSRGHPVFSMDSGACAFQGIRRNDGNVVVLLPE